MKITEGRRRLVMIGRCLASLMLPLGVGTAWAANFELQRTIPEVRLKDGTILHGVTFVSVGSSSIMGKWDGGRGAIPLAQLPDEMRADLAPAAAIQTAPTVRAPAVRSGAKAGLEDGKLPTEIKLTNGFVMHQAKVVSWQADGMNVSYPGGKVLVKLENIEPEQRMIFEAHRIQVYARQARINAARNAGITAPTASQLASALDTSHGEHEALIEAGIDAHQLVVGMTKKQVYDAIGAPARTAVNPDEPDFVYWEYPGLGRNEKGEACARTVGFNKGILDGWKDN